MKLFTDNQADIATVSSSDANINYPASNVQDSRLSRIYKGDSNIDFDISGAGGLQEIYESYTNLVQDPTDLTTANWTPTNCTVTDSGQTINGHKLWQFETVTGGSLSSNAQVNFTDLTGDSYFGVIVKYVNTDNVKVVVSGLDPTSVVCRIGFTAKSITFDASIGSILNDGVIWFDDDTVFIPISVPTVATTGTSIDVNLYVHAVDASTQTGDKVLYSQPILVDNTTTMFPFVDGTHPADVISETFTMPDVFAVDMIIEPKFSYDTTVSNIPFFTWNIDTTHRFMLFYEEATDNIRCYFVDNGTTGRALGDSFPFDDGTNMTLNQRIRVILFINSISGGQTDSKLIIMPLEQGLLYNDDDWGGVPPIKSSNFPLLRFGSYAGNNPFVDSDYEYLCVYSWDGNKPTITSSADADDYFADQHILLDKTYQQKLTATDLLIANSTIRPGDTITLRANDVDSFGSGTPVDETVTWSKDIITHTFTKASHQYWRLSIKSANIIEIGRIYLGLANTPPPIAPLFSHSRLSDSVKSYGISGAAYGDKRYLYDLISIKWPLITQSEKADIIAWFELIDITDPFFVIFDESKMDLTVKYVTIDNDQISFNYLSNPIYSEASLTMREVF